MKKTVLVSMLSLVALVPVLAQAADGIVNFNGEITGQTCAITVNGVSGTATVALPKVSTTAFATSTTAGSTAVTFQLTSCTPASGMARAFFEAGPNVDYSTGRLKVAGGATNVQIGLSNSAQNVSPINIGASAAAQGGQFFAIGANGAAMLNYFAQYVATGGTPTAGKTTTSVTYSIEYQ